MKLTKSQMQQHIEQMTSDYDIVVSRVPNLRNALAIREADGARDEIIIAPVRSEITYAIALHEIGHIRGRYQRSHSSPTKERWAWQWARENALAWTSRMERVARQCEREAAARSRK